MLGSGPRLQLIFVVRGQLGSKEDHLRVCERKMATGSQMEHTALTADIENKTLRIRAAPVQESVTGIPASVEDFHGCLRGADTGRAWRGRTEHGPHSRLPPPPRRTDRDACNGRQRAR